MAKTKWIPGTYSPMPKNYSPTVQPIATTTGMSNLNNFLATTPNYFNPNKATTPVVTSTAEAPISSNNNTSNVQDYGVSSSGSGGYGGGYGGYSAALSALNQAADANRAVAKQTYDTTIDNLNTALSRFRNDTDTSKRILKENYESSRNDLLTSLKRFQEENARNVENQKRSYLADQSALENARQLADRQTRIDTAARGLGGSGLQQLAQLQNLLNQGQDISNLATSNQTQLDALRRAMAQYEEDTNTNLDKIMKTYNNSLNSLDTALRNKEEDTSKGLENALTTYNNALMQINADLAQGTVSSSSRYAGSGGSSGSNNNYDSSIAGLLTMTQNNLSDTLSDISSSINGMTDREFRKAYDLKATTENRNRIIKQQANTAYNAARREINGYIGDYGVAYNNLYNTGFNNLKSIYDSYR